MRAPPSENYPGRKFSTLDKIAVGTMDPFLLDDNPFKTVWTMSKIENLAHAPCLPRFIPVVSSSDTLLVVSALDIRLPFAVVLSVLKELILN